MLGKENKKNKKTKTKTKTKKQKKTNVQNKLLLFFFLSQFSPPPPFPVLLILFGSAHSSAGGNVARLVQPWTVTPLTQVQFPGAAREFFSRVNFQCRLSDVVRALSCAIACINICADSKDPVVHVRVRWIMETLKHAARTVG